MFEEEKLEPEQIKEELDNIGASISDVQYSQEFKFNSEENKYTPEKSKIFHAEEINKILIRELK